MKQRGKTQGLASRLLTISIVALVVLVFDQLTKAWIVSNMVSHETRVVIQGFARLRYTENTGAAFGMLQGWTGALTIVALAIIGVIVVSATRAGSSNPALLVALGMVLGGATGNLVDRLRMGYVVDFVEVYGPHLKIGDTTYTFPVFNVADSAITVGVVLIMFMLLFSKDVGKFAQPVVNSESHDAA